MLDAIWAVISVIAALAGIGLIAYLQAKGPREHEAEEAAREHFDRTGRWPEDG